MLNNAQVCMDAGIIGAAYFFSWYLRFKSGFEWILQKRKRDALVFLA